MKNLTIHIGLHKTGTTYLQDYLFPNLPNCGVVRGFHTHRKLMHALNSNQEVILTDESLSGNFWKGSYEKEFRANVAWIKKVYKSPKIILGVREQVSWLPSLYKQYLHEKGVEGIDFLFNTENTGQLKHEELLILPKIQLLKKEFEEVFIYSQESLFNRQDDFVSALSGFLNLDGSLSGKVNNATANVGVRTNFQINTLIKFNKLNKHLERLHPYLSLYSPVLRKLRFTPRDLCQTALKNVKSDNFAMNADLIDFTKEYYKKDWEASLAYLSY